MKEERGEGKKERERGREGKVERIMNWRKREKVRNKEGKEGRKVRREGGREGGQG